MINGKNGAYRWWIAGLLFVATAINYLDRQVIGLLKPILEREFSWTETDYAHIVMAFTAAYAVGLLLSGGMVDRLGVKAGYSISIVVWSVAGMIHALAASVSGFVAARVALGLGEAGNFPAGVKAIAEWFPQKERGLAMGIFNAGTSVGVVGALLFAPWMLNHYGWQGVFAVTGALGFVWLVLWLIFYDHPLRHWHVSKNELRYIVNGQETIANNTPAGIPWSRLLKLPETWAFIAGKALIDPIYWFFLFWLPSYFSATFSLDLKKPSVPLMIIYGATTVGSVGGGFLSSRLISRGWPVLKSRLIALLCFAGLEVSIILAPYATTAGWAVALIGLAVAVHQAWSTNVFTLASDLFPRESVSSVVGMGGMAGAIGGILFPLLVGGLLDHYKASGHILSGYRILFTICGFTYLFTWGIMYWLTRRSTKMPMAQSAPHSES